MKVITNTKDLTAAESKILILPFFSDEKNVQGKLVDFDKSQDGMLSKLLEWGDIKGNYKEYTIFYNKGINIERTIVIGLGKKSEFTLDRLRSVLAIAARNCRRIRCSVLSVYGYDNFGVSPEDYARAIIEGISLGLYKFTKYMASKEKFNFVIDTLKIIIDNEDMLPSLNNGVTEGLVISEATNFARNLVNEPANYLTPSVMADYATKISKDYGLTIEVIEKEEMERLGMGGLLAVSSGSFEPPKMVAIRYTGKPGGKVTGLVGKGITFDSGGISIKSREQLFRMNCDMAGAAAVLGAVKAIASMKLKCNILAVMPLCENLPSGKSYKVSDIIKSYEGKTIEILDTDAEGRLILADALTYAHKNGADMIIDLATLTGGIVVALGHQTTGIMGTDKELIRNLISAGDKAGELIWELPLFPEYELQLKSDVADIENCGGRSASSITAAIFLKEFTGGLPWAHLDIAGTAVTDEEIMIYVKNPYLPKEGGTGVGVRTLYHFFKELS